MWSARGAVVFFLVGAAVACGKKGPPLAPIVRIPTSIDQISTRRVGNDVLVTMTVPAENIDKTTPADIAKIDVYAYTGTTQPPRAQFLGASTLVATIPVLPPPPEETAKAGSTNRSTRPRSGSPSQKTTASGQPSPPPSTPGSGADAIQGAVVTVRDHLSAEALVAQPLPTPATASRARRPAVSPLAVAVKEGALRRFYLAIPFSPRGRPGPPGMFAELPLTAIPDAPLDVDATVAADAVALSWEPSGGLIGFLLERALPIESSPVEEPPGSTELTPPPSSDVPPGPTLYNVYREIEPVPDAPSPDPDPLAAMVPINPAPLPVLTFSDPVAVLDGRRRCYTVRAVRGTGPTAVESEPSSPPRCVSPSDDFPPAAPVGVSTTADAGAITITWEPNTEADLAGYVILRGEAGDATLTPLSGSVIAEPRYVDRDVRPGVRYVYAVQAIDTHLPTPNTSGESARMEETAR